MQKFKQWVLSGDFLFNRKLALILWFGLSLLAIVTHGRSINNYIIFKHVYWHIIEGKNLYLFYPREYGDVNLYGPVFSLLIAPFALLPDWLGSSLWVMFNASFLLFAIWQLPIQPKWKIFVILLCSHEMMNDAAWYQSNPFIAGCIILGFVYTHRGKDFWALFFILLTTFIKIYGVVGFAFFLFSKHKGKYIVFTIIWALIFFILPLTITNWDFLIQCYHDWAAALTEKAAKNIRTDISNDFQDISVMGMIRRIFHYPQLKNIFIYIPAVILFASQYWHIKYYKDLRYRLYLLCSVMIFTVIFSTGSESPTYIIAFPAMCIWFLMQNPSPKWNLFFIFVVILTTFSYSDLLTPYVRIHIVRPYSLKALPGFITWLILVYQIATAQFLKLDLNRNRIMNNFANK